MNTLREAVGEYLDMRRGLGFKLQEAGKGLIDFITFLEQHNASYITQALALAWAQQPPNVQPAYWAQRLSFVREFARYRSATDRRTQIPLQGLLPFQPKRARPYLYSDEEIRSLLRAALRMPCLRSNRTSSSVEFQKLDKIFEQFFFRPTTVAESFSNSNIAFHAQLEVAGTHWLPPGHGIATSDNEPRSSLA
jgi:hypothetical protein